MTDRQTDRETDTYTHTHRERERDIYQERLTGVYGESHKAFVIGPVSTYLQTHAQGDLSYIYTYIGWLSGGLSGG